MNLWIYEFLKSLVELLRLDEYIFLLVFEGRLKSLIFCRLILIKTLIALWYQTNMSFQNKKGLSWSFSPVFDWLIITSLDTWLLFCFSCLEGLFVSCGVTLTPGRGEGCIRKVSHVLESYTVELNLSNIFTVSFHLHDYIFSIS